MTTHCHCHCDYRDHDHCRFYSNRHCHRRLAVRRLGIRVFHVLVAALFFGDNNCRYSSSGGSQGMFASAFRGTNQAAGRPRSIVQPFREQSNDYQRGWNTVAPSTLKTPTTTRTTTTVEALPLSLSGDEESLLFWITAFSSSHIGMSAIRQTLITDVFGGFLANDILGIVGRGALRLPDFWPGDSSGTSELFPDIETTGRQFYRIFYTMVSFLT